MSAFTVITRGPWRIRTALGDDKATVSYVIEGRSDVVTVETHADLAELRDAIDEYLEAVEANR